MGEMSFEFPADLRRLIEARVEEGHDADPAEYVRDLIRRERVGTLAEGKDNLAEETPEYIAWVRERIAEGEASGFIERDAREVLREIMAERYARRG